MSRTVDPTEIRDTTDRLAHLLTGLDLGSCVPARLAELVTLGERIERLGHGLKTRAAARVAASPVWQGDGDRTPADWLARQTGTSKADAGRLVETGRQLEALPTVDGAVSRGELSAASTGTLAPVRLSGGPPRTAGEGDQMEVIGKALIAPLVKRFLAGIAAGESPSPSFADGARAQEVLDAVLASVARGGWVSCGL